MCAFASTNPPKLSIFECFSAIEPLLLCAFDNIAYLKAKKVADQFKLNAKDATALVADARGTGRSLDEKLEDAARKMRNRSFESAHKKKKQRSEDSD